MTRILCIHAEMSLASTLAPFRLSSFKRFRTSRAMLLLLLPLALAEREESALLQVRDFPVPLATSEDGAHICRNARGLASRWLLIRAYLVVLVVWRLR